VLVTLSASWSLCRFIIIVYCFADLTCSELVVDSCEQVRSGQVSCVPWLIDRLGQPAVLGGCSFLEYSIFLFCLHICTKHMFLRVGIAWGGEVVVRLR
jgi:hypothetical protein